MSDDPFLTALVWGLLERREQLDELDEMLQEARMQQHEPIAYWEAQGYVVECRLGTRFRSELLGAIGQIARRFEQGEDVKLLLSKDEKHCIVMVRNRALNDAYESGAYL